MPDDPLPPVRNQNLAQFDDVFERAYGWCVDYDGQVQGLTAGDMGFEETGITLDGLMTEAEERMGLNGPLAAEYNAALGELIRIARLAIGPTA